MVSSSFSMSRQEKAFINFWWILFLSTTTALLLAVLLRRVYRKNIQIYGKRIPKLDVNPILSILFPLLYFLKYKKPVTADFMFQTVCAYSHVFREEGMWLFWGGLRPILMLYNPETVEPVLNSNHILEKGFEYDLIADFLKEGLLTSKGNKWRYRRKLLTPAFHFRILDEYIPVFNEQAKVFVNKIYNAMGQKKWVDIAPMTSLCTLDIICETAMGKKINAQSNSSSPYVQALHSICKFTTERLMQPWLWTDFLYYRTKKGKEFKRNLDIMDKFTRQVVAQRKHEKLMQKKEEKEEEDEESDVAIGRKSKKRLALLDLLLDLHLKDPKFTLEDIAEEVDNFMFAGHDTTSSGLSFTIYLLGLYPEIQKKVQNELDEILGDDLEAPITLDHLKGFKYLECVIKETRRLFPPTPFIARELTEDTDINGYMIPKGTNCGILIYMLHRNPKMFPNPEAFDPDRFRPENCIGRHPFAYVPFSAGPRNCIGQRFASFEALIVTATVLRHFHIKSQYPLDKLHVVDELVLRSETGLSVNFIPRFHHLKDGNSYLKQTTEGSLSNGY